MIWPHQSAFPYRLPAVAGLWCLATLCALTLARLTPADRLVLPVIAFAGLASAFFCGQLITRPLGLVPTSGRWLLIGLFYLAFADVCHDLYLFLGPGPDRYAPFTRAAALAFDAGLGIGFAAASFIIINRDRARSPRPTPAPAGQARRA
jgi:hypothetical protein